MAEVVERGKSKPRLLVRLSRPGNTGLARPFAPVRSVRNDCRSYVLTDRKRGELPWASRRTSHPPPGKCGQPAANPGSADLPFPRACVQPWPHFAPRQMMWPTPALTTAWADTKEDRWMSQFDPESFPWVHGPIVLPHRSLVPLRANAERIILVLHKATTGERCCNRRQIGDPARRLGLAPSMRTSNAADWSSRWSFCLRPLPRCWSETTSTVWATLAMRLLPHLTSRLWAHRDRCPLFLPWKRRRQLRPSIPLKLHLTAQRRLIHSARRRWPASQWSTRPRAVRNPLPRDPLQRGVQLRRQRRGRIHPIRFWHTRKCRRILCSLRRQQYRVRCCYRRWLRQMARLRRCGLSAVPRSWFQRREQPCSNGVLSRTW